VDTLPGEESGAVRGEREGGRRRGRGRNRRDAGEGRDGDQGDRQPETVAEATEQAEAMMAPPVQVTAAEAPAAAVAHVAPVAAVAPVLAVVPASAAPEAAALAEPFELPIDDLRALASSAGLEWVNSDAERILVVQQAMASEPKPVHVPRAPRPRVLIDDGPLVLVETRKDLSQLKLPFEHQQPPAQG